jgi:hypothetical protein
MAYERLSIDAGNRIRATVLRSEAAQRANIILGRPNGVPLQNFVWHGKLDADLAYDSSVGVTFSIWELNNSNVWADSGRDINSVLPPFGLAHAMVPSGLMVQVTEQGGKAYVSRFPTHYQGVLAGDLVEDGTATVTVGTDSFTGCKALELQTFTFTSGSDVRITLMSDGYYYVDLGPC